MNFENEMFLTLKSFLSNKNIEIIHDNNMNLYTVEPLKFYWIKSM